MPRLTGAEQPLRTGDEPPLKLEFEQGASQRLNRQTEVSRELIRMGGATLQGGQDALLQGVFRPSVRPNTHAIRAANEPDLGIPIHR